MALDATGLAVTASRPGIASIDVVELKVLSIKMFGAMQAVLISLWQNTPAGLKRTVHGTATGRCASSQRTGEVNKKNCHPPPLTIVDAPPATTATGGLKPICFIEKFADEQLSPGG